MLKVLELFSGTGSIGKCCKELGYDVLSLDLELPADINIDIMDWDYKQYKPGDFDIIWASPPCTDYSALNRALPNKIINLEESDKLVKRTLDIIDYFKPYYWFMENPQTGTLKDRQVVAGLPFYDVDYCMYSDWGYKKRTRIWTNKKDFDNKLCDKKCGNIINGKHKNNIGNTKQRQNTNGKSFKLHERYRIPPDLIYSLFLD